jgi:hypothetical protein
MERMTMWDPITVLERIGADADAAVPIAGQTGESGEGVALAPALRSAILEGDVRTIRELLRAPEIVCCLIDPGDEEDDEDEEDGEEEEEEEDDEDAEGEMRLGRRPSARL